ncbi:MAG: hypothetical protein J6J18_10185 [Oscillospiraceae bacterium]|nr:hypothetical protein [Oscillospiraceae bacterium]
METATAPKGRLTKILLITALAVLALLVVITAVCLPYFEEEPQTLEAPTQSPTQAPTDEPTEIPTEAPTEPGPTLPPPEANPYGHLDFQYDGRYLKCLRTETITGIDVSAHQQEIDWEQVKASGVDFVMVRIGYRGYESGKLVIDPYADGNLVGAAAAGLDVGVYFFSQALSVEEAEEEAAFVLEAIKDYELTMPIVYDWETVSDEDARTHGMDARTLTDCSLAFMKAIEEAGYTPMLYFNSHQSEYLLHLEELKDYDFWLAMYTNRMDFPYKTKMWQYTNKGKVPGIEGYTDINVYFPEVG